MGDSREEHQRNMTPAGSGAGLCDGGDEDRPQNYPPFSTLTSAVTHGGIVLALIENCGRVTWSYIQRAAVNLYTLGYQYPARWLDWDADRVAMGLPGAKHAPIWPYLAFAIVSLILFCIVFRTYVRLVRTLNDKAWCWFGTFIGDVVRNVIESDLRPWLEQALQKLEDRSKEEVESRPPDPV